MPYNHPHFAVGETKGQRNQVLSPRPYSPSFRAATYLTMAWKEEKLREVTPAKVYSDLPRAGWVFHKASQNVQVKESNMSAGKGIDKPETNPKPTRNNNSRKQNHTHKRQ